MNSSEKVLLEIQLNYSDSVKKSVELGTEITRLTNAQKELKKAGQENTATFIANARVIDSLNNEDSSSYKEMRKTMPFLFESKRFMSFLSSKVKNPKILEEMP